MVSVNNRDDLLVITMLLPGLDTLHRGRRAARPPLPRWHGRARLARKSPGRKPADPASPDPVAVGRPALARALQLFGPWITMGSACCARRARPAAEVRGTDGRAAHDQPRWGCGAGAGRAGGHQVSRPAGGFCAAPPAAGAPW